MRRERFRHRVVCKPGAFRRVHVCSGTATDSDYRFDSYRLTYRYLAYESEQWRLRIGATAFITAGYRVFEGGVDNGERFAFGWYNFAVVSLGVRFLGGGLYSPVDVGREIRGIPFCYQTA